MRHEEHLTASRSSVLDLAPWTSAAQHGPKGWLLIARSGCALLPAMHRLLQLSGTLAGRPSSLRAGARVLQGLRRRSVASLSIGGLSDQQEPRPAAHPAAPSVLATRGGGVVARALHVAAAPTQQGRAMVRQSRAAAGPCGQPAEPEAS